MDCVFIEHEPAVDGKRRLRCQDCGFLSAPTIAHENRMGRNGCTGTAPRPGDELKNVLREFGIVQTSNCGCGDKVAEMNRWGVAGCREHRDEIIHWLHEAATERGWLSRMAAEIGASRLVDTAILRANERASQKSCRRP